MYVLKYFVIQKSRLYTSIYVLDNKMNIYSYFNFESLEKICFQLFSYFLIQNRISSCIKNIVSYNN